MERILKNTKELFLRRQNDIVSSALLFAGMIVVSRFFGFIRYRTLTTFFTTNELDIFFAAFRVPDFVFEVLITGALSSAFIPLFIRYKQDDKTFSANISSIINVIITALIIGMLLFLFLAPYLMPVIAPGFTPEQQKLVVSLARMLIAFQLPFLVFGGILSGIAQANRIFLMSAIAPVLYNVAIIIGTWFLAPSLWLYGPVCGVIIGAMLLFLVQIPILFASPIKYQPFVFVSKVAHDFFKLFSPRLMTVIAGQIDMTVDLTLASLLGSGAYSTFYLAQQIQFFPVALIGVSFGQASLPYVSELFEQKKLREVRRLFVQSLLQLLFLSIPIALFFIFARTPIVRIIAGGRKFDWEATNLAAHIVSVFAISIPFHSLYYFLVRVFYACRDTKTPFYINMFFVLVNIVISSFLVIVMKQTAWVLALAFSVTMIGNVLVSLIVLYRKIHGFHLQELFEGVTKMLIATVGSALPAYVILRLMDSLIINTTRTLSLFFLMVVVGGAYMAGYLLLAWLLDIKEITVFFKLFARVQQYGKKLREVFTDVNV